MTSRALYACIFVREFPAQALVRLRPELHGKAVVVLAGEPPLQTVRSLNTRARLLGVSHGMSRVEVEHLHGALCLPCSPAAEASAQAALMECASSFSPRLEIRQEAPAFLCCMDVSGTEALFGPPEHLGRRLRSQCAALGLSVQVVLSTDFHTAILAAKGLPPRIGVSVIRPGEEAAALCRLPLSVLPLSESQHETLGRWGIRSLGMLAALPSTQLIARLGQGGKHLQQLATGTHPHLFQPVEVPLVLEEHTDVEFPLENLESLIFGLAIMLDQLIVRASLHAYALAAVTVELQLENGSTHRRSVSPRVPTNDRHLWLKLLRLDLEAHPAPAPVTGVRLHAEPGTAGKVQLGLFCPQLPEPGRLDVTLARIAAIVGEDNVGSAVLDDTHAAPGFHLESFAIPSREADGLPASTPQACLRRLTPPSQVAMETRKGQPVHFFHGGRRCLVEHAYGPWLLGSEWWSERSWAHEQWDVAARLDTGSVLFCCLLRDHLRNAWYLAGLYD